MARTQWHHPDLIFFGLTFLLIIIVVLVAKDLSKAALLISLLTGFLLISGQLAHICERSDGGEKKKKKKKVEVAPDSHAERFSSPDGGAAEYGRAVAELIGWGSETYPGAIPVDSATGSGEAPGEVFGDPDQKITGAAAAASGDPYDNGWIDWPPLPVCGDAESNDFLSADEKIVVQGRWRNEPERVLAGTFRRRDWLAPYIEEDLAEDEDRRWWGRSED